MYDLFFTKVETYREARRNENHFKSHHSERTLVNMLGYLSPLTLAPFIRHSHVCIYLGPESASSSPGPRRRLPSWAGPQIAVGALSLGDPGRPGAGLRLMQCVPCPEPSLALPSLPYTNAPSWSCFVTPPTETACVDDRPEGKPASRP